MSVAITSAGYDLLDYDDGNKKNVFANTVDPPASRSEQHRWTGGPISIAVLEFRVQWVGLQCVIVVFPDHTHLLSYGLLLL